MKAILISLGLSVLSANAWATDIAVNAGGSIQAAIVSAVDGDRILVGPGTYLESLDLLGKAIEVIGVQGAGVTVVDANLLGAAVRMQNGEGPLTVLRGLTITRGSGGYSPGGVVTNGNPTLIDCIITSNFGRAGAGVHGNPTLLRCTISNNTSSLNHGGGIWGAPTMDSCIVRQNTCTGSRGGGLYIVGGQAALTNCQILDNRAILSGGRGGGIYVDSTGSLDLDHCLVAGNLSAGGNPGSYGGGIFTWGATTITRCTIANNTLGPGNQGGGGVYGPATIADSIVYGNTASELSGATSVSFSDVQGGAVGTGNINANPKFVDNVSFDFHLMANSPCIDAADPLSPADPDGTLADMGAYPLPGSGFSTYCTAAVNSTGLPSSIGYRGSASLTKNDLELLASDCPPMQFGIFLMGTGQTYMPVASGFLCVGGTFYRLPIVRTDAQGSVAFAFDASHPGVGAPAPAAGSTWNFQLWHRDFGGDANFTEGLTVPFVQ